MKTLLKIFLFIITLIVLISLFSEENNCYFQKGDGYDQILIGKVVSESVLKYAKFDGATASGIVKELKEVNDSTATVIVSATLKAKNAFGVYMNTTYDVEATLNCNGYSVVNISDR